MKANKQNSNNKNSNQYSSDNNVKTTQSKDYNDVYTSGSYKKSNKSETTSKTDDCQ